MKSLKRKSSVGIHNLTFNRSGRKQGDFLIPQNFVMTKETFLIYGRSYSQVLNLSNNGGLLAFDPQPDPDGIVRGDRLIIDFHQMRTIHEINLSVESTEPTKELACILRVWGGSGWYLPLPVNLIKLKAVSRNETLFKQRFPPLKADKIMLSFVKLNRMEGTQATYLDLSLYPVDDLMEVLNFSKIRAVEEMIPLSVLSLSIHTDDFLSGLSVGIKDHPPLFLESGEFTVQNENSENLDGLAAVLRKVMDETEPVSVDIHENKGASSSDLSSKKSYYIAPFQVFSKTSGIFSIKNIDLGVRHVTTTLSLDKTHFMVELKDILFQLNSLKHLILKQRLWARIPSGGVVKKLIFKLKGSLSHERRLPFDQLFPIADPISTDIGLHIEEGESILSFLKTAAPFHLSGVELMIKTKGGCTAALLIRNDDNGEPNLSATPLFSLEKEIIPLNGKEDDDWQWCHFDFSATPFISEDTTWLELRVIRGDLTWHTEMVNARGIWIYRIDNKGTFQTVGRYLKSSLITSARFLYTHKGMDDILSLRLGNDSFPIPIQAPDFEQVFEKEVYHSPTSQLLSFELSSLSEGVITLSEIKIEFEDPSNPVRLVF